MRCPAQTGASRSPIRADPRLREACHVEVLGGLAEVDLQLLELSANVLVDVMGASDETPRSALALPLAPDVVSRVPPLVLLGGLQEAEPPLDQLSPAAGHGRPVGDVELAVRKARVAGLELEMARLEEVIGVTELHEPTISGVGAECTKGATFCAPRKDSIPPCLRTAGREHVRCNALLGSEPLKHDRHRQQAS